MAQMSFSEKLKILVDVSSSSGICIASIFILIFMAFLFLTTTRKNAKSSKKLYLGIYIALVLVIFAIYNSSLVDMFDYMMNNFFIVFYFPNLAIYLAAIITTNILLWTTIFNFKEDKLLKVINTIIYCIIHYLLILILNTVTSNELNVFDQTSVYGNKEALALIGLSSTIFVVWIIFLIIYKIIRRKQKAKEPIPVRIKEVVKYKRRIPNNIKEIPVPVMVKGNLSQNNKKSNKELEKENNNNIDLVNFYQQQNNLLQQQYQSVIKEQENSNLLKQYENMLTLDDYKTVLNLLKQNKNNTTIEIEKQESIPTVSTSQSTIINKRRETNNENDEFVEQPKIEELLNLYRSI